MGVANAGLLEEKWDQKEMLMWCRQACTLLRSGFSLVRNRAKRPHWVPQGPSRMGVPGYARPPVCGLLLHPPWEEPESPHFGSYPLWVSYRGSVIHLYLRVVLTQQPPAMCGHWAPGLCLVQTEMCHEYQIQVAFQRLRMKKMGKYLIISFFSYLWCAKMRIF